MMKLLDVSIVKHVASPRHRKVHLHHDPWEVLALFLRLVAVALLSWDGSGPLAFVAGRLSSYPDHWTAVPGRCGQRGRPSPPACCSGRAGCLALRGPGWK